MITISNYQKKTKGIDFSKLPDALQSGHKNFNTMAKHYDSNAKIKEVLDSYIEKLNQALICKKTAQTKERKSSKTKSSTANKKAKSETTKTDPQKKTSTRRKVSKPNAEKIEKVNEEVRFIKRFVLMNGKEKTKKQFRLFINALQKAIVEKRIRKSSKYAKEIMFIQEQAMEIHDSIAKDEDTGVILLGGQALEKLHKIAYSETVMPEIAIIKQYIGLNGKTDVKERAERLLKKIERAYKQKQILSSSKYHQRIKSIKTALKSYLDGKSKAAIVQSAELRGLQGIANLNVSKKKVEAKKGNPHLMNSTDFIKMKFDTIGFTGKWLKLIGDPSKGFTVMIYGKPKMGKSYLAVDFAGYLARNHGRALYVAKEEKLDATLKIKLKDKSVAHQNLDVSDYLPSNLSGYDFVFIDSVNKMRLSPDDIERLRNDNKDISFIFIFQTTKEGNFRGANEFQHDVDVVIQVPEKGKAVQYGRFNQGGEIDIF
jgi:hypothetical protein